MLNLKKETWLTIFFVAVVGIGLLFWFEGISKTTGSEENKVSVLIVLGFSVLVVAGIYFMNKPYKINLTPKKDNYHPENFSDHSETNKIRKNIK